MEKQFGIVSRYPEHLAQFSPAYYEVKDVTGVWHDPLPDAIPMVSIFGDNQIAKAHPDWVQVGPDGMLGTRQSPYFDWDTLCPSQDSVWDQALSWVRQAISANHGQALRLDDVTFAREGFCQCRECDRKRGSQDFLSYRIDRLTEFVQTVRPLVQNLHFTVYPDPFPGHLERRFGLSLERLSPLVDTFVVPIYDIYYGTTYWLEILAQAFRERIDGQWFVELYGLGVEEKSLQHAAEVAWAYANGVVIAYDNNLDKLLSVKRHLKA